MLAEDIHYLFIICILCRTPEPIPECTGWEEELTLDRLTITPTSKLEAN